MDYQFEGLTKKERKKLKKQLELEKKTKSERKSKTGNYLVIAATVFVLGAVVFWFAKAENSPKPGQSLTDLGREHVAPGTVVQYNSNPPTSGSHLEEWTKGGLYSQPQEDGKLIHSLEHGYIIISYNCDYRPNKAFNLATPVFAHDESLPESTDSAKQDTNIHLEIEQWKDSKECQELVSKLEIIGKSKGWKKIIVVPRPNLDDRIALTAWTRIDKFKDFDESRINKFIKAYYDRGPEKTME